MGWDPIFGPGQHPRNTYNEFRRLAAYLGGFGPGTPVSGTLSVVGTWYAECAADTNNNGDTNVTAAVDAGTIYEEGESFIDTGPETSSAGIIVATFLASLVADDTLSAPFTSAGMNCGVASPAAWPVNYSFVVDVAPSLADGQSTVVTITTPPLLVEAGANIQMNPFLNSGDPADKFTLTADSFFHIVKLA